jgi:hypothetical protein
VPKFLVFLTGPIEHENLGPVLQSFDPELTLLPVSSREDLLALPMEQLAGARLVAFATPVVVPGRVLRALGFGGYNFHPGPPAYPGWHPPSFAIHDQAEVFGATFHRMAEKVDSGPIVAFELFEIPPGATAGELSFESYRRLVALFQRWAGVLATWDQPLPELPVPWGSRCSTRRDFARLCEIPADIGPEELALRLRAFGAGDGESVPTVTLHGHRFCFCGDREESV